jgi:uncharacterized membrane protein YccC
VTPYSELWRRAVEAGAAWWPIDLARLLGVIVCAAVIGVLGAGAVWRLWRHRRAAPIR